MQTRLIDNPRARRSRRYRRAQAQIQAGCAVRSQHEAMFSARRQVVKKLAGVFPNASELDCELAADIGMSAMHRTWLTKPQNLRLLDEAPAKFVNFARFQAQSRAARWLGRQLEHQQEGTRTRKGGLGPRLLSLNDMDNWSQLDVARLPSLSVEDEALGPITDADTASAVTTALAGVGEVNVQAFIHGRYADSSWADVAERLGLSPEAARKRGHRVAQMLKGNLTSRGLSPE